MAEIEGSEFKNQNDFLITKDNRQIGGELIKELVEAGGSWTSLMLSPKVSKFFRLPYLIPYCNDPKLVGVEPPEEWIKEPRTNEKPKIIYCTWMSTGIKVNLPFIKRQIEAFKKIEIHPNVFIIDAGWFTQPGDWLSVNKKKFPHGLEEATKLLRENNIEPWLWWGPYNVDKKSQLAKTHPDWLVKKGEKPLSFNYYYKTGLFPPHYILDPRNINSQNYLEEVEKKFKDWGFAGIKADFLSMPFFIPEITQKEALNLIHKTLKGLKEKGLKVLACGCPFSAAVGVADYIRVSNDSGFPLIKNSKINEIMADHSLLGVKKNRKLVQKVGIIPDPDMYYSSPINKKGLEKLEEAQKYSIRRYGCLTFGDDFSSLSPEQVKNIKALEQRFHRCQRLVESLFYGKTY